MKIILILSGGMDSTTLLYDLISQKNQVECLSYNYGQRHKIELTLAESTCRKLDIPHKIINIQTINELIQGSSLTSDIKVPEGHYADESMKATVVPNRNMIMIALAVGYAVSKNFNAVAIAVHGGDHAVYPDCREEFIKKMDEVCAIANYKPIKIIAPYLHIDKGDIVARGRKLKVDYSLTHTCYKGDKLACGKCGACQERLEAFRENKVKDPIKYR